jgi:hypothetical protein
LHIPVQSSASLRHTLEEKDWMSLSRYCCQRNRQKRKSTIIWDIMSCSPLTINRLLGGTYRLHLHGRRIRKGADKSLTFPIPSFPICSTTKRFFFLDGLKNLKQRSHNYVELPGGIRRVNSFFFQSRSLFSL